MSGIEVQEGTRAAEWDRGCCIALHLYEGFGVDGNASIDVLSSRAHSRAIFVAP